MDGAGQVASQDAGSSGNVAPIEVTRDLWQQYTYLGDKCDSYSRSSFEEGLASLDREPCLRAITPAPTSEELILLTLDGTRYPPGPDAWRYVPPAEGGPAIRFFGSLCAAIESSTAQKPVQLDLRILRVL